MKIPSECTLELVTEQGMLVMRGQIKITTRADLDAIMEAMGIMGASLTAKPKRKSPRKRSRPGDVARAA